jgi:hypothetical protein
MSDSTTVTRDDAIAFAMRVYAALKNNRGYALTERSKTALAAIGKAILDRRIAEGKSGSAEPTHETEFTQIIQQLAAAGCNVLQQRPGDKKPLPKLWLDPVSGLPLPPPKTLDEKGVLARRDPELLAHFEAMKKAPYQTVATYLDQETEREAAATAVYNAETHATNPYRDKNYAAMTDLVRRDPATAKRYAAEALEVTIFKVGKGKNIDLMGALSRNPEQAAVIKNAVQILDDWRASDRRAAAEQAANAAQQLKALENE